MSDAPTPTTILVVDDNEANRYAVARLLRREGYRVWEAGTGAEGLRLAQDGPDLVILDIRLPDIDGFEVLRRLRGDEATRSIPIVHLSASFTGREDRLFGLEKGADAYLTHPVEPRELSATVGALLRVRAAEARLRSSVREWRATFDAVADGICLADASGFVVRCNRSFTEIVGRPFPEVIGQPLRELLPQLPPPEPGRLAALGQVPADGGRELWHRDRCYRVSQNPLLDESGVGVAVVYALADITERVAGERERTRLLRELEEARGRLAAVFEQMPSGVIIAEAPSGRVVLANARIVEIHCGTFPPLKDVASYGALEAIHLDGRPYRPEELPLARAVQRGEAVHGEVLNLRRTDGTTAVLSVNAAPIRDSAGAVIAAVAIIEDITERRALEDARAESESLYQLLADTLPHIVYTTRPDGAMDFTNRYALEYTGARADNVLGLGWASLVHPEDVDAMLQRWRRSLAAGEAFEAEYRLRRADGQYRWQLSRAVPVRDGRGGILRWIGSSTDIHERRLTEEALRDQTDLLERVVAERTAALKESYHQLEAFSYTVAHDLRAPLRAIRGYTEAILEDFAEHVRPRVREYGGRVTEAASRMDSLIRDLLAYSRLGRADLALDAVELSGAVAVAVEALRAEIDASAGAVEVRMDDESVLAHRATLEQVVANLVANAVKFVAPGVAPRVVLRAERRPAGGPAGGGGVRLWVEDNGIGIAPEYHERIFRVFERLHGGDHYPGTGVGLAIVRKGVERMGGRVGLESAPGQGSRFWVELRAADPIATESSEAERMEEHRS